MTKFAYSFFRLVVVCVFSSSFVQGIIQDSINKVFGTFTSIKNVRIPVLLNQLCNQSQVTKLEQDACYGCFFKASTSTSEYPMLLAMANCADLYLDGTDYGHCQAYLKNATTNLDSRISPTLIYCTFLECIRQVNKNALLQECVAEAKNMFPKFNGTTNQLAQLYVNTTACVLAKTRCAILNPITGEYQDDIVNKFHVPSITAVLVNTDYDINIVQLPPRLTSLDLCAKYRNIEQAHWRNLNCQ